MRILILGGSGMLGHKLWQVWRDEFDVAVTLSGDFESVDRFGIFERTRTFCNVIADDFKTVGRAVAEFEPDVIFNAIGVVKQLPTSKDVIKILTVNSIFPHRLAELGQNTGARVINISTDCVFAGEKGGYTEDDVADATDLYGRSKHFGEITASGCLTLRTSIIGRELGPGHSLVEWFLSCRGGEAKGFANAIYSGFPTVVMADIVGDIIEKHPLLSGLYHVSSDPINKYELLKLLNDAHCADVNIIRDEEFRIDRSLDSERFREVTGFAPPAWTEMIAKMAADTTPYDMWKK